MTTTTDTTSTNTTNSTVAEATGPTDPLGTDLTRTLRALKLGGLTTTLPERLVLARARKMGHAVPATAALRRGHPTRVALGDAARPHRRPGPGHAARHLGRA